MGESAGEVVLAVLSNDRIEAENRSRSQVELNCENGSYEKEDVHATELEPSVHSLAYVGFSNTSSEKCTAVRGNETVNGSPTEYCLESELKDACDGMPSVSGLRNLPAEGSNVIELDCSSEKQGKEVFTGTTEFELSDKEHLKEGLDSIELENGVKEASNEDVFSEVSNPNLSPRESIATQFIVGKVVMEKCHHFVLGVQMLR